MSEKIRYVGLDVHKDTITAAVADEGRGDARVVATIPNETLSLLKQLRRLGPPENLRCRGYGRLLVEVERCVCHRRSTRLPRPAPARHYPR